MKMRQLLISVNFCFGAILGAVMVTVINVIPFTLDRDDGFERCADCYWEAGFPFVFYKYGSILHLDDIVVSGLIGNIVFGLFAAVATGLLFAIAARRFGSYLRN